MPPSHIEPQNVKEPVDLLERAATAQATSLETVSVFELEPAKDQLGPVHRAICAWSTPSCAEESSLRGIL